ncbi:hypothetical protein [Pseudaminobacter sp. NGMCC 1.201702]|uniref:hypothetical protein n=1 Tax=Pseudaminobacter sp. NGMCC 1.201702 TaxID=3391825 RepID=UPI0039EE918D
MEGNNELRLNEATMQKIVQEWLDREFKPPAHVKSVSYLGGGDSTFVVRIGDKPNPPPFN